MSSAKWRLCRVGLNVLKLIGYSGNCILPCSRQIGIFGAIAKNNYCRYMKSVIQTKKDITNLTTVCSIVYAILTGRVFAKPNDNSISTGFFLSQVVINDVKIFALSVHICEPFEIHSRQNAWWRHQMETFSALQALCAGNSPVTGEQGRWRGALMFSFICAWMKCWVNNREAGGLRRQHAHYDVSVMWLNFRRALPWPIVA